LESLSCYGLFFTIFILNLIVFNFILDAVINKGGDESVGKGDGKNYYEVFSWKLSDIAYYVFLCNQLSLYLEA
jgi:hypothetical protein